MKFSIFMMPLHHPTENPSLAFDRDIELIRYVDELGFDEFFIGEHHSGGCETMPAPEMALAAAFSPTRWLASGRLQSQLWATRYCRVAGLFFFLLQVRADCRKVVFNIAA